MAIQNLPKVSPGPNGLPNLSIGDYAAIFSSILGSDAAVTLGGLVAWLQGQLTPATGQQFQYFAPNASGFSVTISPTTSGASVFLLMTPTGGFAAGTIILPTPATAAIGQEVLVTSTQAVTALTVSGNGAVAVNGAPTTLTANGFFRLKYDSVSQSWFRVG